MNACCQTLAGCAAPVAIAAHPTPTLLRRWWSALCTSLRRAPEPPVGIGELDARMLKDIGWCCEAPAGTSVTAHRGANFL
jgi:hypothetical protein